VLDYDRSPESRLLIERFHFHETFDLEGEVAGPGQMRGALDAGAATAVLVVPAGFGRFLGRLEPVQVQILLDGVDSNAALIAYAHARGIVEDFTLDSVRERLQGEPIPDLMPRAQVFYNPELKSRFYMVPGIVVMLLTMLTSILTGLGLVREREKGTLEQLSVTPIRSWQLMIGKTLPFVVIAFFVLSLALSIVLGWYRVPMRGSWGLLVAFALLFLLNTLSLGLLISTVAHSQQQALFMAWFAMVFGIIMSGLFFPIENMPEAMQQLTYLNPLRYFLAVVRELFLKGSGLGAFGLEITGLLILGPSALALAAVRFRKRAR